MHVLPVYLTSEQIGKLRRVLTPTIPIYPAPPASSFPTLHITPKDFLRQVLLKLTEHSINISSIRLHGGAASYVLIKDSDFVYRDIDILFTIKTPLSSQKQTTLFSSNNEPYLCDVWTIIKYIISSCLIEHIPNASSCTQYFISSVLDTYAKKNIKICSDQDSWALLSLQNLLGQNLELKFVENIKRQWQFSVDSFQINLKPLLFEKNLNQSLNPEPTVTKIQTKGLMINAINGVNIIKKDTDKTQNESTSPIEFGFFSRESLKNINENESSTQYQTLAKITTIQSSDDNNSSTEFRSDLPLSCQSTINNEQLNSSFQFLINEDVDDGIEVDTDDLPNEDDDQVCHKPLNRNNQATMSMGPVSASLIEVFSVYNDLHEALYHLNNKLIATYEPETMRGGGLLKYCDLLARNYKLYNVAKMIHMQRYMCSRFCIDYKTIPEQIHVIAQYVATHFLPSSLTSNLHIPNNLSIILQHRYYQQHQLIDSNYDLKQVDQIDLINARLCLLFFEHLSNTIHQSTVCLTHEDRELLLININQLKYYYHAEYEHLFAGDFHHYQKYHNFDRIQRPCTNSSSNSSRSVGFNGQIHLTSPSSSSTKSHGYYCNGNAQRKYYIQRQLMRTLHQGSRINSEKQTVYRRNQS